MLVEVGVLLWTIKTVACWGEMPGVLFRDDIGRAQVFGDIGVVHDHGDI